MSGANHKTTVGGAGNGEWRTPPDLFAVLKRRYQFDYDAFATHENALCYRYSTADGTFAPNRFQISDADGIAHPWLDLRVWMNPPYTKGQIEPCMEKAAAERDNAAIIVALLPAATDTRWWHQWVQPYCDVTFLSRRVRFIDPATGEPGNSPPGGHAIAVYRWSGYWPGGRGGAS